MANPFYPHSVDVLNALYKNFPAETVPHMYQIALEESRLKPTAYNPESHKGCDGSFGIFQIACVNYSGNPKDLYDIETNVEIAKKVLERQGFSAWGVCRDGKVDCPLDYRETALK